MNLPLSNKEIPTVWFVILFAAVLCLSHIGQGTVAVDAIRYATIANQIIETDQWIDLIDPYHHVPYANKPHLLFWILACAFKIFGYSTFIAKLPSGICAAAALIYLYLITARYSSPKAGIYALLLLVCTRSFSKDIVDLGFDSIGLLASMIFLDCGLRLADQKHDSRPALHTGTLLSLGIVLTAFSKPPYLGVYAFPFLCIMAYSAVVRARIFTAAILTPAFLTVTAIISWYGYLGIGYWQRAVGNQVGVTLDIKESYLENIATWMHSFFVTLAPLSWASVLVSILIAQTLIQLRRSDQTEAKIGGVIFSKNQLAFILSWLSLVIPIVFIVAVRPRYLWSVLPSAALVGGILLSTFLSKVSLKGLLSLMMVISIGIIGAITAGIELHRSDRFVSYFERSPITSDNLCIGEDDQEGGGDAAQRVQLLLKLHFSREFKVFSPSSLPETLPSFYANARCRSALELDKKLSHFTQISYDSKNRITYFETVLDR